MLNVYLNNLIRVKNINNLIFEFNLNDTHLKLLRWIEYLY